MKRLSLLRIAFPLLVLLASPIARGNQEVTIEEGLLGYVNLNWTGVNDRTYFVQGSDDMETWFYFDIIEPGVASFAHSYGFSISGERLFFRLAYWDGVTADPYGDDFDNDGISNLAELISSETDPLVADSNGNGTLDGAEDSDADGVTDGGEATAGTQVHGEDNPKVGLSAIVVGP